MANVFQSLWLLLAGSTHKQLARQVKYLKAENEILRSKLPARITVTPKERQRLIRLGAKLGKALRHLISIVHPDTFLRWMREEKRASRRKLPPAKRGRPLTPEQLRRLVLKLARENDWGLTRILGELKKLKVGKICRSTVRNILKAAGFDPGPKRGEGTWDDFIKRHAVSLWQCDFFSKRVVTANGIREAFVLIFLNVKTRRVVISLATFNPEAGWVAEQAGAFVRQARRAGLPITKLMRDRDSKFSSAFSAVIKRHRIETLRGAYRSPNLQAYAERFVQSIKAECLDRFVVFGLNHLGHLCKSYVDYYHTQRPHQGADIGNEILVHPQRQRLKREPPIGKPLLLSNIRCHSRLGGLLKSYSRKAA